MTDPTPAMTGETITSAAELDALPVGSVVRTSDGQDTWVCYLSEYGPRWVGVEVDPDDYAVSIEHKQHWLYDALPLTVLYRPDRPAAVTVSDEGRAAAEERMGRVMGWQYLVRYSGQKPEWMADTLGALARAALASRPQAAVSVSREQIATARREFFDVMSRSYLSSEAMADDMVHSIRRALGIEVRDE